MIITEFRKTMGCNGQRDRKESHFKSEVAVIAKTDKGFHVPVTIREYRTPSKVSFCIWTTNNGADASGSGSSKHYADAMFSAISSMGILLDNYGCYDTHTTSSLMEAVARMIMEYFEYPLKTYFIHTAHA